MFDFAEFQTGAVNFLIAFAAAAVFTVVFKLIYKVMTPYHEGDLIKAGNSAASVALWGAIIGYVLPLASALSHTVSLPEFAGWAVLAGVIQIIGFAIVRMIAIKDVKAKIEAGDMATGIYIAGLSITIGLLNAACITA